LREAGTPTPALGTDHPPEPTAAVPTAHYNTGNEQATFGDRIQWSDRARSLSVFCRAGIRGPWTGQQSARSFLRARQGYSLEPATTPATDPTVSAPRGRYPGAARVSKTSFIRSSPTSSYTPPYNHPMILPRRFPSTTLIPTLSGLSTSWRPHGGTVRSPRSSNVHSQGVWGRAQFDLPEGDRETLGVRG